MNRRIWLILIILSLGVATILYLTHSKQPLGIIGEKTSNLDAIITETKRIENTLNLRASFTAVSYEDLVKRAGEDLANKTALFDVILQYPLSISSYAKNNWIVKVRDYHTHAQGKVVENDAFFANVWKEIGYYKIGSTDAEAYGYPFAANTILLCYNKMLFGNAEYQREFKLKYNSDLAVPKTWVEYVRVAEFFSQGGRTRGVSMLGADSWICWEWANFAFSEGGGIMQKQYGWETPPNTALLIDSPESIRATKLWLSLKPFNADPNFLGTGMDEQIRQMQKGNVALCLMWSDQAYNLVYGSERKLDEYFGFSPIPGDKSMIAGGIFMVNAASQRKSAAIEYITSLLTPSAQVALAQKGLCSAVKATYDDPTVASLPYTKALLESLIRGKYMLDAGPDSDIIFAIMSRYLQQIWKGDLTVEDGLVRAKKEIEIERDKILK